MCTWVTRPDRCLKFGVLACPHSTSRLTAPRSPVIPKGQQPATRTAAKGQCFLRVSAKRIPNFLKTQILKIPDIRGGEMGDTGMQQCHPQSQIDDPPECKALLAKSPRICRLTRRWISGIEVAYRGGATKKISSVVVTAVFCRLGTTRECQKMGANQKNRVVSPQATQASGAKEPFPKSSRRAAKQREEEIVAALLSSRVAFGQR